MKTLRHLAAAALASLFASLPATATTYSVDYTDLWYLPSEDGWGVNVQQQYEVVFATLFVYGADNTPRWFVGPATTAQGQSTFTGPLYTVTGTHYGVPWAGRTPTQVGNITFTFTSPTTGTVSYTANNVQVTKSIVRQTWRANVLTGSYVGGVTAIGSGCQAGNLNILVNGELSISHANADNPTFQIDFFNSQGLPGRCTYTGTYSQQGRFGRVLGGTFTCQIQGVANPPVGTFNLSQLTASQTGLSGRYQGSDQYCSNYNGYFGGVRDVL